MVRKAEVEAPRLGSEGVTDRTQELRWERVSAGLFGGGGIWVGLEEQKGNSC